MGFGPDDDDTGTICARFVFNDERGGRYAMITVAKDAVTGRWLSDFSLWDGKSNDHRAQRSDDAAGNAGSGQDR